MEDHNTHSADETATYDSMRHALHHAKELGYQLIETRAGWMHIDEWLRECCDEVDSHHRRYRFEVRDPLDYLKASMLIVTDDGVGGAFGLR